MGALDDDSAGIDPIHALSPKQLGISFHPYRVAFFSIDDGVHSAVMVQNRPGVRLNDVDDENRHLCLWTMKPLLSGGPIESDSVVENKTSLGAKWNSWRETDRFCRCFARQLLYYPQAFI